jgi:hypothetical protein
MAPSEYQRALNEVIKGKFRCARLIVEVFRRHARCGFVSGTMSRGKGFHRKKTSISPEKEQGIRLRAHEIWEREGRPGGKEAEHRERVSREIESEEAGEIKTRDRSGANQGDV